MTTDDRTTFAIPVAWGDMDAFGHVNNTVYLKWFESARIDFFRRLDIPQRDVTQGCGPILARTSCTFELPLTFPDTVDVSSGIERIGTKSFVMHYAVTSREHGRRAAHGDGVIVWYDYARGCTAPLPDDLRTRLEAYVVPSSAD